MHNLFFVPITLTLFFIAEPFIKLWVGVEYLDYLWVIKLSIIFQLVWQSSALFGQIYLGLGYSRKPGIIGIIVNICNGSKVYMNPHSIAFLTYFTAHVINKAVLI